MTIFFRGVEYSNDKIINNNYEDNKSVVAYIVHKNPIWNFYLKYYIIDRYYYMVKENGEKLNDGKKIYNYNDVDKFVKTGNWKIVSLKEAIEYTKLVESNIIKSGF